MPFTYAAAHLPMRFATPWPPKLMNAHYADPLPWFEEVSEGRVKKGRVKASIVNKQQAALRKGRELHCEKAGSCIPAQPEVQVVAVLHFAGHVDAGPS